MVYKYKYMHYHLLTDEEFEQSGDHKILADWCKADLTRGMGFIPNFFRIMANDINRAIEFSRRVDTHILNNKHLDQVFCEALFQLIANDIGCEYCEAIHRAFCSRVFKSESIIDCGELFDTIKPMFKTSYIMLYDWVHDILDGVDSSESNAAVKQYCSAEQIYATLEVYSIATQASMLALLWDIPIDPQIEKYRK